MNIFTTVSFPIVTPGSPLQFLDLARLNSTFGVIMYRDPNSNWKISAALVDTTGASGSAILVLPAVVLHPGTGRLFGLGIGIDATAADRITFSYNDAYNQAYVQDAGVYGPSIVLGRFVLVQLLWQQQDFLC